MSYLSYVWLSGIGSYLWNCFGIWIFFDMWINMLMSLKQFWNISKTIPKGFGIVSVFCFTSKSAWNKTLFWICFALFCFSCKSRFRLMYTGALFFVVYSYQQQLQHGNSVWQYKFKYLQCPTNKWKRNAVMHWRQCLAQLVATLFRSTKLLYTGPSWYWDGWPYRDSTPGAGNLSQSNQPPRSTQPGHPFVGRRNEYWMLCDWE